MSLVTKTIDSRILGKEMNLAVYRPAVNDNSALPVLYFLHGRTGNESLLQWLGMEKTADAECYFADEAMWLKNDPISIAKQAAFDGLKVFLDDGKEDEGQFYHACEKLFQLLRQNGTDVQNHLFMGHHSGDYIKSNMETYLRFYS